MRQKDVDWLADLWERESHHLLWDEHMGYGSAIAIVAENVARNTDPAHPIDTSRLRALAAELGWSS